MLTNVSQLGSFVDTSHLSRSDSICASCHASNSARDLIGAGKFVTAASIANPSSRVRLAKIRDSLLRNLAAGEKRALEVRQILEVSKPSVRGFRVHKGDVLKGRALLQILKADVGNRRVTYRQALEFGKTFESQEVGVTDHR